MRGFSGTGYPCSEHHFSYSTSIRFAIDSPIPRRRTVSHGCVNVSWHFERDWYAFKYAAADFVPRSRASSVQVSRNESHTPIGCEEVAEAQVMLWLKSWQSKGLMRSRHHYRLDAFVVHANPTLDHSQASLTRQVPIHVTLRPLIHLRD